MIKEAWRRNIYTRWIKELNTRRVNGQCPKCGIREWYQLKTGFHAKWQCEKCGLIINKKDVATGRKWWDYIVLYAKEEIKRKKKSGRSLGTREFRKDFYDLLDSD